MFPRPHLVMLACTSAALAALFAPPAIAQSDTVVELYTLCSNFPHNSRCKGYTAPTSLKQRPGAPGVCILKTPQGQNKGDCKIILDEKRITLYQEIGNPIAILDNQRDTQAIVINTDQIGNMSFRTFVDQNIGGKIVGSLLFGISTGTALAPDRPMAEITLNYADKTQATSIQTVSTQNASVPELEAKLVMRQNLGYELRSRLEQMTGKQIDSGDLGQSSDSPSSFSSTPPPNARVEIQDLPGGSKP